MNYLLDHTFLYKTKKNIYILGEIKQSDWFICQSITQLMGRLAYVHSEKILQYYSGIGGCLVAQNTVAEIWSNTW